ncbi:MAG: penicillin-binding protein 2 [Gallionellales bacterium 35-53-114]|nr:MAG: penicillin-binding protein 2 [Gallionellales bacterium 35-53-114]OYZ64568.1 MAG: penicillin-binding protein 2 [Gallionellales bacterium 24-53-125]OZB10670.1 MAG: penicillin-binding protein 2 [Gallionellales bacterium 39-52-133]
MQYKELKNNQREIYFFRLRLILSLVFVLVLAFILLARLVYLQVVRQSDFATLADKNRISVVPIVPNRGLIQDRNGVVLAQNYSGYTLEISPAKVDNLEATINALSELVSIQAKDRKRFKKLLTESHTSNSYPIRSRLSEAEVARFASQRFRFPGVEIKARLFREYPYRDRTSHLIGYVGRINDKDFAELEKSDLAENYRGSDYIGKIGVEQSYERELHGTTGFEQVEVDAAGRGVRVLSRTPPQSGKTLTLTVDIKLQEVAETAFGDFRGALVAIDPSNGEVLAFVSKPGYDPNLFVDGIDTETWDALNNSLDVPLNNRALRGQYPPGSTIKPFMAIAGLDTGKRTPSYTISDPGYFTLPGNRHQYRDWKVGGHGRVDMFKSIVISCDTYYYGLATDMGIDGVHDYMEKFGFGKKTGLDMEGESAGLLPSQDWKRRRFNQIWYPGDTVSVGIGQGYTLVTPLQLAYATAILANNGVGYRPHLVKLSSSSTDPSAEPPKPPVDIDIHLKSEYLDLVKKAMIAVTLPGGTAAWAGSGASYQFAGKTGTAQVIGIKQGEKYVEKDVHERHRDHAWFIAFAPADKPRIALAVLAENAGHGGSIAAPIARKVIDYYLLGKVPPPPQPLKIKLEAEHD